MAELLTGKTLFPGTDHIDQLTRIMKVCGTPNEELLRKIQSDEARSYIRSLPTMQKQDFKKVPPSLPPGRTSQEREWTMAGVQRGLRGRHRPPRAHAPAGPRPEVRRLPPPALPSPALPCPALPSPALPVPAWSEGARRWLRLDATKCLEHEFLSQYHDPDDEPEAELLEFNYDMDLPINGWRGPLPFPSTPPSPQPHPPSDWQNSSGTRSRSSTPSKSTARSPWRADD